MSGSTPIRGRLLSVWRQPLSVYAGEPGTRHASWLELFFDLVFVVAVAELGGYLHDHLTPVGLLHFAALFALVWWLWLAFSYYADTYDTEDPLSRLLLIAVMFGVIFLSQTIDGALAGGSFAFAAGVLLLRVLLTVSHARAYRSPVEARPFVAAWIGLEVLVTLVWGMSLLVPEPGRFGLWIAAFVLSTAGITVAYLNFEGIVVQTSYFPERLGLFTILVLGETILAVSLGLSVVEWGPRPVAMVVAGFLVAVAAWWLYFGWFDDRVVDAALAERRNWLRARQRGIAYIYSHYLVHAGIVAAGLGIAATIEAFQTGANPGLGGRLALGIGVLAFLIGSGLSHRMTPRSLDDRAFAARIVVACAVGFVVVAGGSISPFALVSLVALSMVGLVLFERVRRRVPDAAGVTT